MPGLAQAGHHFYSETAVCALHQARSDFTGGRIVVGVGGLPMKCPVAPPEFTFLLADHLASRKLLEKTEITYTYLIDRVSTIPSEGWVKVDRHTLEATGHPGVFALGDASDLPVSKAGSAAPYQAGVVASRIAAAVRGSGADALPRYEGKVICFLETGRQRATFLSFDYQNPRRPARPSFLRHYQKLAFNRLYCALVPTGRV